MNPMRDMIEANCEQRAIEFVGRDLDRRQGAVDLNAASPGGRHPQSSVNVSYLHASRAISGRGPGS